MKTNLVSIDIVCYTILEMYQLKNNDGMLSVGTMTIVDSLVGNAKTD